MAYQGCNCARSVEVALTTTQNGATWKENKERPYTGSNICQWLPRFFVVVD